MAIASPAPGRCGRNAPGAARRRRISAVVAPLLLLLAGCSRAASNPTQSMAGIVISPGIPKPDFTFRDTRGEPYNFRERTRGKLTLLFFGYTHCPDVCPLQMANIAYALHQLPPALRRNVAVVFVTTDSARDTPARLRQWLDGFDTSFVGLTGTLARVNAVLNETRFLSPAEQEETGPGTYQVGHSAVVLAFARDDSAHLMYPLGVQETAWAADLQQLANFSAP